ncbi:hypothetical protein [Flavivirga jejuensis]|uniref:Uncharacterized protein n=1 Tax=Flavivirga jejuensis TaxID=870487 RepID=A0ABT8WSE8_9FLAO|nr:hypothetical protein [Flavivirga jejuensis]MDO5976034.1 hypothetical protein [Flavivirga jejuensis]
MNKKPRIISNKVANFFDKMLEEKKVRQNELRRKLENGEFKVAK